MVAERPSLMVPTEHVGKSAQSRDSSKARVTPVPGRAWTNHVPKVVILAARCWNHGAIWFPNDVTPSNTTTAMLPMSRPYSTTSWPLSSSTTTWRGRTTAAALLTNRSTAPITNPRLGSRLRAYSIVLNGSAEIELIPCCVRYRTDTSSLTHSVQTCAARRTHGDRSPRWCSETNTGVRLAIFSLGAVIPLTWKSVIVSRETRSGKSSWSVEPRPGT